MGSIIILRSDKFLDSFVEKFNYKNFNFVLVSADIKTKRKYTNVYPLKALIPPSKALSCKMNGNDIHSYRMQYIKYLGKPTVEIYLTTIVKLAVVEDTNVVLMCSKQEDEFGYMDIIKEYLQDIYKVKVFKYKEFKKNPEKCNSAPKKDKVVNIINRKIEQLSKCEDPFVMEPSIIIAKMHNMSHKELSKLAKRYGIKIKDKDISNKALIKKIKKKIC